MADFVYNIAKGKIAEYAERVNANDPTNAALIIIPINSTEADATLQDLNDFQAIKDNANTSEVTGFRKTIDQAGGITITVDDTDNEVEVDMPDQTWTAVTGTAWTDLVICYDSDTTGGTDSNLIPLVQLDFALTPDGSDVTVKFHAEGFFNAG